MRVLAVYWSRALSLVCEVALSKELSEELRVRWEDPALFDMLRDLAEKAWHVNGMHGSSWCNVDIRVLGGDGKPFILVANPKPRGVLTLGARIEGRRDPGNVSFLAATGPSLMC